MLVAQRWLSSGFPKADHQGIRVIAISWHVDVQASVHGCNLEACQPGKEVYLLIGVQALRHRVGEQLDSVVCVSFRWSCADLHAALHHLDATNGAKMDTFDVNELRVKEKMVTSTVSIYMSRISPG